jgi:hypothetical protein
MVVNDELVESWSRYDVAPLEAFHDSVKVVAWFVEPVAGEARTGAAGGVGVLAAVWNERIEERCVPPEFWPATRK